MGDNYCGSSLVMTKLYTELFMINIPITLLSGVVYDESNMGPNTEPWEHSATTPKSQKVYFNHLGRVPPMLNCNQLKIVEWPLESNTSDKSSSIAAVASPFNNKRCTSFFYCSFSQPTKNKPDSDYSIYLRSHSLFMYCFT